MVGENIDLLGSRAPPLLHAVKCFAETVKNIVANKQITSQYVLFLIL